MGGRGCRCCCCYCIVRGATQIKVQQWTGRQPAHYTKCELLPTDDPFIVPFAPLPKARPPFPNLPLPPLPPFRYRSYVNEVLQERTVASQEGALDYLANSAALQQFKQVGGSHF